MAIMAIAIVGLQHNVLSQVLPDSTNDFKIGMFGPRVTEYDSIGSTYGHCYSCGNCRVYAPLMRDFRNLQTGVITSRPTSHLKVLGEDGFNIVSPYMIGWADNHPKFAASLLQHIKNSGMQCLLNSIEYYFSVKADYHFDHHRYPDDTCYGNTKFNFTRWDSPHNCGYIPNYGLLFDSVYLSPQFRDVIWGHKVTEEAAYRHPVPFRLDVPREEWQDSNVVTDSEIPVPNVVEAMDSMRLKDPNVRLIVMEACHNGAIRDGLHDMESRIGPDTYSYYQAYEYLTLPGYASSKRANVFFEGSYMDPMPIWVPWYAYTYDSMWTYENVNDDTTRYKTYGHYLGQHKTIDWAYKYVDNVHEVINYTAEKLVERGLNPDSNNHQLHTHPDSIRNANFLHFQAYTSIIHKANGIWFWDMVTGYVPDEDTLKNSTKPSRFERENFPRLYNKFVAPLSRQLRYLVNKNLLTTDLRSHVAHKTDDVEDRYNMIRVNGFDTIGLFDVDSVNNKITVLRKNEHYRVELRDTVLCAPYSPRYTLRSNGKEDLLIVSNPLFSCVNSTLDLVGIAQRDDIIRNADSCHLLFEGAFPTDSVVRRLDYKVFRDTIDWRCDTLLRYTLRDTIPDASNVTVPIKQYETIGYTTAIDSIGFGPADVHLFQFGPVDNRWYDKLCDISEDNGTRARTSSPIAVDNDGTVYYLNHASQMMATSVDAAAATSLGFFASPQVHFTVNPQGTVLYYADPDGRLRAYDLATGTAITGLTPLSVRANSNIECRGNTVFFIDAANQLACIDELFLQRNQPAQTVSTIAPQSNIGFAVGDEGDAVYFLAANNQLYQARYSNFSWTADALPCNTTTPLRGNTRLHYVNGAIYGIRNSDGVVHRFYDNAPNNGWRLDWLESNIAVDEGTDIVAVESDGRHVVYFVHNHKVYACSENNIRVLLSPTPLASAENGTRLALYDDKIIFVGAGNRIHTLSYRHNYTQRADLYIKDSPQDKGMEPNNQSPYFYVSNDIWVRRQSDGLTQHQCETPSFDDGSTYVYVRVRNKSLYPSPENAKVTLYWQWANVSAAWPAPWDGSRGADKGGRIAELVIPSIPGGGDTILEMVWPLPSKRHIDTAGFGHYCLLAQIDDGIPIAASDTLLPLLKRNNNMAMRNISIFKGRRNPSAPLSIANYQAQEVDYIVRFEAMDETPGPNIMDVAQVIVNASDSLQLQFQKNGKNMEPYEGNAFRITGEQADVRLTLPANSEHYIVLRFEANDGDLSRLAKTTYRYRVHLLSTQDDEILSGEEYQIQLQ